MAEDDLEIDPLDPEDVAGIDQRFMVTQDLNVAQAQHLLRDRRDAYLRFFAGLGGVGDKRVVMEDLRRFCRGGQSAWAEEPRLHALLTGRQEVYQRITDHLDLSFDDLWERYK